MGKYIISCLLCKKERETYNPNAKYCSRKCSAKSPLRIKKFSASRTRETRTRKQVGRVIKNLFKNRKLFCENCGTTQKIHIHHIDKDILNNRLDNLIPLCATCHPKLHLLEWGRCKRCGRWKFNAHRCPDREEYRIVALKMLKKGKDVKDVESYLEMIKQSILVNIQEEC